MKQLLAKRAPLTLVKANGKVEGNLPKFLKKNPFIAAEGFDDQFYLSTFSMENGIMLGSPNKMDAIFHELLNASMYLKRGLSGVWSGTRSCLVRDDGTGELYRLKGISFGTDPMNVSVFRDGHFHIEGGQTLQSARFEKIYSDRFNKTLREHGLETVMEHAGFYKYPQKFRNSRIAASIMKVKGDTRLDELFFALELLQKEIKDYGHAERYNKAAAELYLMLGTVAGSMKKLMDSSMQTWSDNNERTNAHIGNIVAYRADETHLGIGFVDFDASCDSRDMSKAKIERQQKAELETLVATSQGKCISFVMPAYLAAYAPVDGVMRAYFVAGLESAYHAYQHNTKTAALNRISSACLDEAASIVKKAREDALNDKKSRLYELKRNLSGGYHKVRLAMLGMLFPGTKEPQQNSSSSAIFPE